MCRETSIPVTSTSAHLLRLAVPAQPERRHGLPHPQLLLQHFRLRLLLIPQLIDEQQHVPPPTERIQAACVDQALDNGPANSSPPTEVDEPGERRPRARRQ